MKTNTECTELTCPAHGRANRAARTTTTAVHPAHVQPGDMAHRRDGSLDPRPVECVIPGRPRRITLRIGTTITDPIPASWYRFTRAVQS